MRSMILLSASLALTACATSVPPSSQARTSSRPVAVECTAPPCRIGANGTKLTGLAVELSAGIRTIALPSGELVPVS